MQTNADRSKKYVVLEREHVAIEKEIQKHRINVEIIKKEYVAVEKEIQEHPHQR